MSGNRRRTGNLPGLDCPAEIDFAGFVRMAGAIPVLRVQGKVESATKGCGRLVRFNRAVRVHADTARVNGRGDPIVRVQRVRYDWRTDSFVDTNRFMVLTWRLLDWVSPQASGDPNGTWLKVTLRGEIETC